MKPILSAIPSFDANIEICEVYFYWTFSPCIGANLKVTNPLTDEVVWEGKNLGVSQRYNRYMCIIPTNSNIPNITADSEFRNYSITVEAIYQDTEKENTYTSDKSDPQPLYTYAKPEFRWDNDLWIEGRIVRNSSVTLGIVYNQTGGEDISSFILYLYNADKTKEIANSGLLYNKNDTYKFTGLVGGEEYYVTAKGTTEFGRELKIDYSQMIVRYDSPQSKISVTAENLRCEGLNKINVFLNANLYAFDHGTEYDEGRFDDDTWIDLNEDGFGNGLTYTNSSGLDADNSIGLTLKYPIPNSLVAQITDADGNHRANLYYHEIEQNFWDSMAKYNMQDDTSQYNPFYYTFTDEEKAKYGDIVITKEYIEAPKMEFFENATKRNEYWDNNYESEQEARREYPVPAYEHTTRRYGWFSLQYGATTVYTDRIDVTDLYTESTNIVPDWHITIRNNDGYYDLIVIEPYIKKKEGD